MHSKIWISSILSSLMLTYVRKSKLRMLQYIMTIEQKMSNFAAVKTVRDIQKNKFKICLKFQKSTWYPLVIQNYKGIYFVGIRTK